MRLSAFPFFIEWYLSSNYQLKRPVLIYSNNWFLWDKTFSCLTGFHYPVHFCHKHTLLAHIQHSVHQEPEGPFLQRCSPANQSPACTGVGGCSSSGAGLCTSSCWTAWGFCLRSLWIAAWPFISHSIQFCAISKLVEVTLRPIIQIIVDVNRTRSGTDPRGTPPASS